MIKASRALVIAHMLSLVLLFVMGDAVGVMVVLGCDLLAWELQT